MKTERWSEQMLARIFEWFSSTRQSNKFVERRIKFSERDLAARIRKWASNLILLGNCISMARWTSPLTYYSSSGFLFLRLRQSRSLIGFARKALHCALLRHCWEPSSVVDILLFNSVLLRLRRPAASAVDPPLNSIIFSKFEWIASRELF